MEHLQGCENICLSGGAAGADVEWGKAAHAAGHKVIHWGFTGHKSTAPKDQIVELSDEQLKISHAAVRDAARALDKNPPKRPGVAQLIQRNYFQVAWSTSCYAVTAIRTDIKPGGTAWATVMFAQLHPESRELYIFDQLKNRWVQWNGKDWDPIDSPPRPTGIWAGIGSRDLTEGGREAIRKLMDGASEET